MWILGGVLWKPLTTDDDNDDDDGGVVMSYG